MKRLIALLFVTALARAASSGDAEAVKSAEKTWVTAALAGDADGVAKVLADDLIYVHSSGRVETKQQLVDAIRSKKQIYNALNYESTEVKLMGNTAVAASLLKMASGTQTPAQAGPIRFMRVYAKRKGQWVMVAHQSTRITQ